MELMRAILKKQPQQKEMKEHIPRLYQVTHSSRKSSLPTTSLRKWNTQVKSACTGPNAGITQLDICSMTIDNKQDIAEVQGWDTHNENNYGISASLYEEDSTHSTNDGSPVKHIGDPIADVYAAVVRDNNTVSAIADGCGWGRKPRLAARCAVRAAVQYVTDNTARFNKQPTSETLLNILRDALDASQECIIEHRGTTTTLSIAVTCQMANGTWGLFTVTVGDSRIFVYSTHHQTFMEVTLGSHPADGMRSIKNCGGALGPAYGTLPDLENLSFSFMPIAKGDLVVLMTDGVSDNFLPNKQDHQMDRRIEDFALVSMGDALIPTPHAKECTCCQGSYKLHRAVREHCHRVCGNISARSISIFLLESATKLSEEKRQFRSECMKKGINAREREREDPEFAARAKKQVGKLDHATVLSFAVGY